MATARPLVMTSQDPRPLALAFALGGDPGLRAALRMHPAFELAEVAAEHDLLPLIDARDVAVLLVGPAVSSRAAVALLARVVRARPGLRLQNIVVPADDDREAFQELVDHGQLFYVCDAKTRAADVAALVASALAADVETDDARSVPPELRRRVFAAVRRLSAASDLGTAAGVLERAIEDVLAVERASLLLYDAADETLSRASEGAGLPARESAASGLVAFAARTASVVCVAHAGEDPRYDRASDDPGGAGDERLLAVPLAKVAVLVVVRRASDPPFSDRDLEVVRHVAEETTGALRRLVAETALVTHERRHFRSEALAHHLGTEDRPGELLRLSSGWTSITYVLLLAALVVALIGAVAFRVDEYASGPAVVRFEDKTAVTTTRDGIIALFSARPGEVVTKGQSLVRLVDGAEAAEAERRSQELELGLAALLRDPQNDAARSQLATARVQRDAAQTALAERTLRAPRDGIVSAIHVRVGQKVTAGDVLLSLVGDNDVTVVALLPGRYRAELKQGTLLRFQLAGYEHVYQTSPLASIGEVVSAPEAARYLGLEGGTDQGPVVVVSARLKSATYAYSGQTYRYHDGMPGTVDVRVRSEPALLALVPVLRILFEGDP